MDIPWATSPALVPISRAYTPYLSMFKPGIETTIFWRASGLRVGRDLAP
jgi:hypothetical protein